jgi:hypothetical protein
VDRLAGRHRALVLGGRRRCALSRVGANVDCDAACADGHGENDEDAGDESLHVQAIDASVGELEPRANQA